MKRLIQIQHELRAPKNQTNAFGKYKYRSAEDIIEAVKPLLYREGLLLTISDNIIQVGDRVYIQSNVNVTDGLEMNVNTTAQAREPLTKKGMDEAQITGSTSSYARKYALNGMFAIDDNKDADTMSPAENTAKPEPKIKQVKLNDTTMEKLIQKMHTDFPNAIKMMGIYKNNQVIHNVQYSATEDQLNKLTASVNTFKKENKFCDITGNVLKWWVYSVDSMKKWNGEIYDNDLVYIDGVKYRLDSDDLKKFIISDKYKSKQDLNKMAK